MYRRCADTLLVSTLLASLLALTGCGSSPIRTESSAAPAEAESAATTTPLADKNGVVEKASPAGADASAPAEAVRQFEAAVSMLSGGNSAGAESAFRTL